MAAYKWFSDNIEKLLLNSQNIDYIYRNIENVEVGESERKAVIASKEYRDLTKDIQDSEVKTFIMKTVKYTYAEPGNGMNEQLDNIYERQNIEKEEKQLVVKTAPPYDTFDETLYEDKNEAPIDDSELEYKLKKEQDNRY